MPYVKQEYRDHLDPTIDGVLMALQELVNVSEIDGSVNYVLTRLIDGMYGSGGYTVYNRAMGVLDCVAREFYRRRVVPYEGMKIVENGDVYHGDVYLG